jgi:hypothetical protein
MAIYATTLVSNQVITDYSRVNDLVGQISAYILASDGNTSLISDNDPASDTARSIVLQIGTCPHYINFKADGFTSIRLGNLQLLSNVGPMIAASFMGASGPSTAVNLKLLTGTGISALAMCLTSGAVATYLIYAAYNASHASGWHMLWRGGNIGDYIAWPTNDALTGSGSYVVIKPGSGYSGALADGSIYVMPLTLYDSVTLIYETTYISAKICNTAGNVLLVGNFYSDGGKNYLYTNSYWLISE